MLGRREVSVGQPLFQRSGGCGGRKGSGKGSRVMHLSLSSQVGRRLLCLCTLASLPAALTVESAQGDGGRGNPACWTMGFTFQQCCNALHGGRGNPVCWDAGVHNFDYCCQGQVYKASGCAEFVAHFDFSVLKLIPEAWERCVEGMEQRPQDCNSASATSKACPDCAVLSEHTVEYIRCVRQEQPRVGRADGGAEGSDVPRPAVGGWHYPSLFVPRTAGRYFHIAAPAFDSYVGNRLVVDGQWMFHEEKLIMGLMRPGEVFVDAGANIGGFTLPLAKHLGAAGQVHAFEPFRLLFQCLNANVMLNGLSNVYTYQVGLGNKSEVVRRRQPALNSISNPSKMHVAETVANTMMVRTDPSTGEGDYVRVQRLDEIEFGDRGPDFIKVDVESMEMPMLQGSEEVLRRFRPSLYVEDSEMADNPVRTQVMSFLQERRYLLVDLVASGFSDATSSLYVPEERKKEMLGRLYDIDWDSK
ncbi:unnamed protein product [Polarella glacialis]|uniref:Methyltransferase FkbM domain-containing protein n=1 Tax=Polarella glacialis TaxID=89957 RepID=A0A813EPJ4_POLGL|nr:unnamed protein product [Polarella glacialis]CAE8654990.1 unnamed protein product [Polarella glacialis]